MDKKFLTLFLMLLLESGLFAQVQKSLDTFKSSDFYQFFNYSQKSETPQGRIFQPGALQEYFQLLVEAPNNLITQMTLKINSTLYKQKPEFEVLALDMWKSFILLNAPEKEAAIKELFENYSTKKTLRDYYAEHLAQFFRGKIPFFAFPLQTGSIYFQRNGTEIIACATSKKEVKPLTKPVNFLSDNFLRTLEPTLVPTVNQTNGNTRAWNSDKPQAKIDRIVHIAYEFLDKNSALSYLVQDFEEFTEKGIIETPSTQNKLPSADLLLFVNMNNNPLANALGLEMNMLSLIILKDKKLHKIFISGNSQVTFNDLILLGEKVQ